MMTKFEALATDAMATMLDEIAKHRLETLQHYPDDLRNDRATLLHAAEPGASFGWKVGHCGTHLIQLGLHTRRNEFVTYVTRDSSSDRFYHLVFTDSRFKLKEVTAAEFERLVHTPVKYQLDGGDSSFSLSRDGIRIGTCRNEFTGDFQTASYRSTLTMSKTLTKADITALHLHARFCCVNLAHSLFFKHDVVIDEPHRTREAA